MKNNIIFRQAETLDDVIFENRNKAYGAYYLTKKAGRYLFLAFLIVVGSIATAFTYARLNPSDKDPVPVRLEKKTDIILLRIDADENPEFKIPAPSTENIVKQTVYLPPVVVHDADRDEFMLVTEDIIDQTRNTEVVTDLVPVIEEFPIIVEDRKEKPFVFVEEEASFRGGGLEQFHSWVSANLMYPQIAIENEISGRVFVQFCVDTKGEVTDVVITRGLDDSINEEVLRVLTSSPRWIPARQGGVTVKQLFSMSVVFDLQKTSSR